MQLGWIEKRSASNISVKDMSDAGVGSSLRALYSTEQLDLNSIYAFLGHWVIGIGAEGFISRDDSSFLKSTMDQINDDLFRNVETALHYCDSLEYPADGAIAKLYLLVFTNVTAQIIYRYERRT